MLQISHARTAWSVLLGRHRYVCSCHMSAATRRKSAAGNDCRQDELACHGTSFRYRPPRLVVKVSFVTGRASSLVDLWKPTGLGTSRRPGHPRNITTFSCIGEHAHLLTEQSVAPPPGVQKQDQMAGWQSTVLQAFFCPDTPHCCSGAKSIVCSDAGLADQLRARRKSASTSSCEVRGPAGQDCLGARAAGDEPASYASGRKPRKNGMVDRVSRAGWAVTYRCSVVSPGSSSGIGREVTER